MLDINPSWSQVMWSWCWSSWRSSFFVGSSTSSGERPGWDDIQTQQLCESSWKHSVTVTVFLQTYSFDLQRPPPSSHLNEPTGTFEPMCLDDLGGLITWLKPHILAFWSVCYITDQVYVDQVTPDGLSPSSCANGTAPRSDEKAPDDQTDTTRGAADTSKPPREKDA